MQRIIRFTALISLLVLGACNVLPTQPARFDPYQGLMAAGTRPKEASERPPVQAKGKSVALIISDSTETQFKYIEDMISVLKNNPVYTFAWRDDMEAKVKPNYLVGQVVDLFRSRFARAELVDDFNGAIQGRYDYIAVIDLAIRKPTVTSNEYVYDAAIDLLTTRIERIVHLSGHGAQVSCLSKDCHFPADMRAMEQALGQLRSEFDRNIQ